MSARQRRPFSSPKAQAKGVETSGAASKSKNSQKNSVRTKVFIESVYGWNYKGPAILGRAVEFDARSIALFRLVTALNVLWDVCFEFLPDAGWFLTDEGSYSRKYYIGESNKEHVADWSLYMMSRAPGFPHILLVLHAIIAVIFAIGIRPRLSAFFLWIMHRSIVGRNQEILHGGDSLVVACIVMALFLPCDFYKRPDLVRTTRRLDMSVLLVWATLLFMWVGNCYDKWGYAWKDDYTATFLSFGYSQVSTTTANFIRSTTLGWHVCKLLTFSAIWVEFLCPLLIIFPGGEFPAIRVLGCFILATMHTAFGFVFRLGSFGPAGVGCAVLMLPTWFWDALVPFVLRRAHVYKWCLKVRQSFLWLYVNRINPDSRYALRIVPTAESESKETAKGLVGVTLASDNSVAPSFFGKAFVVAIGLLVAFANYPRTYTFVIALGCAAFTKAILMVIEAIYVHWEEVVRVFWKVVAYVRIAFLVVLSLSVYSDDIDRWKNPETDEHYINPTVVKGLDFISTFFRFVPARGVFSDAGMSYGVGSSGWHIAAGIRGNDTDTVEEFWPFTSSTSPFAPFYNGDGLSVPRPLSMEWPYLNADEYSTSRWESFVNSKGATQEMARYICMQFRDLNLTVVNIYKIDIEATVWREKPYNGYTPPWIHIKGHRICQGGGEWGHESDCEENCAWDLIDDRVRSDWRNFHTPEKILHERDVMLRTRLLSGVNAGEDIKVRLRENHKRHRIGDAGTVVGIDEGEFRPVEVDVQGTPDFNGNYRFHYHDLEVMEKPPMEHKYIALPNKFCIQQNDLDRFEDGPAAQSAEACQEVCSQNPECLSVEYYKSEPFACQLSSTCDAVAATTAKPDWLVTLFVKKKKTGS